MKRSISIILVAFLLILSVFALAACDGGVSTEEEWNAALDYLRSCQAATVKKEETQITNPSNLTKKTLKKSTTVAYNAQKGILYFHEKEDHANVVGAGHENYTEKYFVVDGANIHLYYNTKTVYSSDSAADRPEDKWVKGESTSYDDETAAALRLGELFLEYCPISIEDLDFNEFSMMLYGGTFEKSGKIGDYNISTKLKFSNGKLTKYTYESKPANKNVKDSKEWSITIKYTSNVTLPKEVEALR